MTPRLNAKLHPGNIPAELRSIPAWAPWAAVWNPKRLKYDKIPKSLTGGGLSTATPERWFSFDAALGAVQATPGRFAGIGFNVTGRTDLVMIDLDGCVNPDGNSIAPWARDVVKDAATYTEISPSGKGLRIVLKGSASDWTNHDQGIEVYCGNAGRFLTITGDKLPNAPASVNDAPEGFLEGIEGRYRKAGTVTNTEAVPMPDLIDSDDLEPLESLSIRPATLGFLRDGTTNHTDRSRAVAGAANDLASVGLTRQQVLSYLADSFAMEVALSHRHDKEGRALLWLWDYHVCKIKATPSTADDFETLQQQGSASRQSNVLTMADFIQGELSLTYVWQHVLVQGWLYALTANPGSGKTAVSLYLAVMLALGRELLVHRHVNNET